MADQVLVTMPDNLRDFLVSIPAIQDYQIQLVLGGQRKERDPDFQVTFRMSDKFKYFEPILQVVKGRVPIFDYSGWNEYSRGEYDCFIEMDFKRAAKITQYSPVQMAQALGVMIGAGPQKWPVIRALDIQPPEVQLDILVLKWGDGTESERFSNRLLERYPHFQIIYDYRDLALYEAHPEQLIEYVQTFRCVISPVSSVSYIAALLKKALIEIFPTYEDMVLFNNVGIPYYQQVIGCPTSNTMWRLWEERWEDFKECLSVTNSQEHILPEEPLPSIAGCAEEKSLEK